MSQLSEFEKAIRYEGGVSRRLMLAYSGAFATLPLIGQQAVAAPGPIVFSGDPFRLGVASGDPDSTGFVIWTKLSSKPLQPDGGMDRSVIPVSWEVAEDDAFRKVVATGTAMATPQLGHSVHVELSGLKADRWYWYRFRSGDAESPVGRTRTMPEPHTMPDRLKFVFASCQSYEQGLFTAYEHMAKEDLDLVFHLGDYIYEYKAGAHGKVRKHIGAEIESLDDYRVRYCQYRMDPLLQAMHANCPWFVTWDDHEFDNNCANDISEGRKTKPVQFLERRANAYQAYYEMMPLRRRSIPRGPNMDLYRKASFGRLAEFMVLDERQYRSNQPNGDKKHRINKDARDESNTMLGASQRNWLCRSLITSQANWNVLAQQVMMGMVGFQDGDKEDDERIYSMDQWPGYVHERKQLLRFMKDRRVPNPVVLTGDIHSNWVNELRVDDRKPEEPVVATEFVGTSLTSGGNGSKTAKNQDSLLANSPCVRFHNRERGYVACTVTKDKWTADYRVVSDVEKPGGNVKSRAKFVVESGDPAVK